MATLFKTLKNDWSISATVAGFLAVLISYSGPLIIFFQAAQRAHVSTDMMVSWIWGISIGAAVSGIYLSIKYKTPVITAWSAPGTALLVTLFPNVSLNEAVAAYITSAIIIFLIGITGYFDKLLKWIPQDVAAGMMAGILFQFGINLFTASDSMPFIVFSMLIVFLIAKRLMPRYTMIWVLAAGVLLSLILGKMNPVDVSFNLAIPQGIGPELNTQPRCSSYFSQPNRPIFTGYGDYETQRLRHASQTHYYSYQYCLVSRCLCRWYYHCACLNYRCFMYG